MITFWTLTAFFVGMAYGGFIAAVALREWMS